MSRKAIDELLSEAKSVIDEPLKFKAKLAIGEDAYTSLRAKNSVLDVWDTFGVAIKAAAMAKSPAVATAFFAPKGLLAAIGIGAASTPIGWVIAAGLVSGGTWSFLKRFLKKHSNNLVDVIPRFINTPMDILALGLFYNFALLALKIANINGTIDVSEKNFISDYFIDEWGYNPEFVKNGLELIESEYDYRESYYFLKTEELAYDLAIFQKDNPDCNHEELSKEIINFLRGVIEADGRISEEQTFAVELVDHTFEEANKGGIIKFITNIWRRFRGILRKIINVHRLIRY